MPRVRDVAPSRCDAALNEKFFCAKHRVLCLGFYWTVVRAPDGEPVTPLHVVVLRGAGDVSCGSCYGALQHAGRGPLKKRCVCGRYARH